jgi:hypothetical protein
MLETSHTNFTPSSKALELSPVQALFFSATFVTHAPPGLAKDAGAADLNADAPLTCQRGIVRRYASAILGDGTSRRNAESQPVHAL